MMVDLKKGVMGDHPSNCGGLIAFAIGKKLGVPAFIVDPVVVDELIPEARISGMPLVKRKSIFHALNQKAVARQVAKALNKSYMDVNVIIAHLGGGITVGCHRKGYVVDVNNGLDGDGPFSAERSGSVPVGDLIKACYSGAYTLSEMKKLVKGHGGMVAYLGTNDMKVVEKQILEGNETSKLLYDALIYQVCKEIGALSTVVSGELDAIALTGGMAKSDMFVNSVKSKISFLAPVYIFPGEQEMLALAMGALRVLRGEEDAKIYTGN